MSALSDLLNQARGDKSVRAIGRAATAYGVGESTVIPYFNGKHGTPSVAVLEALAEVLPVKLADLRIAAGLPAGEAEPYVPPAEANLLDRRQRVALDELIRSIVATRGATDADLPTSTGSQFQAQGQGAAVPARPRQKIAPPPAEYKMFDPKNDRTLLDAYGFTRDRLKQFGLIGWITVNVLAPLNREVQQNSIDPEPWYGYVREAADRTFATRGRIPSRALAVAETLPWVTDVVARAREIAATQGSTSASPNVERWPDGDPVTAVTADAFDEWMEDGSPLEEWESYRARTAKSKGPREKTGEEVFHEGVDGFAENIDDDTDDDEQNNAS